MATAVRYDRRATEREIIDDLELQDDQLERALEELRWVNTMLGGYSAMVSGVRKLLPRTTGPGYRLLDLGTGSADIPEHLVRWGARTGRFIQVLGLDANPATIASARASLDQRLEHPLRSRVYVEVGDALRTGFQDGTFDVVTASLFAHHMTDEELIQLLREMGRLARRGIVINDLHRHPVAYYGFKVLSSVAGASPMVRNDGPLSVLRAFRRKELLSAARQAGLEDVRVTWHWAFRWLLVARRKAI